MDREDNYELDLGISCLHKHFERYEGGIEFSIRLCEHLTKGFNKALEMLPKYKTYKAITNNDPYLDGNWGGSLRTMTEQACELGIPSIQLEIPNRMRAMLFKDSPTGFSKAFLKAIVDAYTEVIVPWWPTRKVPQRLDEVLAVSNLTLWRPGPGVQRDAEAKLKEWSEWEKKQTSTTEKII